MRVLYFINGMGTGGAERSLFETGPRLRQHGIDLQIACLYAKGEGVEDRLEKVGLKPIFLPERSWAARLRSARRLVAHSDPDVVHTTIFEANVTGRLAAAARPVPVLTSLVNTSYDPARSNDPNVSMRRLNAMRILDAVTGRFLTDHFHAITVAARDAAVRDLRISPERITVIPRGRDEERLGRPTAHRRSAVRAALQLSGPGPVLLNVGRQEYQKGQIHLLQAVAHLRDAQPDVVCLIAGREGNATVRLREAVASAGLHGVVRFLGHRDDVPDLMAAADVFVFPSLYEGLGGSLLEAMALEVPVVASDIPAIREVTDGGRSAALVPPRDSTALAEAISELVTDQGMRDRYVREGRRIFEDHYRLGAVVNSMAALYRKVAELRG